MPANLNVIQFGLGPIGSAMARHVLERQGLSLVGAVDVDPAKAGRDIGEVIALGRRLELPVDASVASVLRRTPAQLALHTTSSYFPSFKGQILELMASGLDIVSTSEELSFPWLAHPAEAVEIDQAARQAGRRVLATGVNPGFLMDSLPLSLTAICQRVDHIHVQRAQNASLRRGPFQAKIGSGLTVEEFSQRMAAGSMGHVGLPESVGMLFDTLGRKLVRYASTVEPVIATQPVETRHFGVPAGKVIGLKQVATGESELGEFVRLTFIAALDNPENQDTITIRGLPDLNLTLCGTHGDVATVAIAVNAIKRLLGSDPGLHTMRDLPFVTYW